MAEYFSDGIRADSYLRASSSPRLRSSDPPSTDPLLPRHGTHEANTANVSAPRRVVNVEANSQVNRRIVSLEPKVVRSGVTSTNKDLDDLTYWPTILKWKAVSSLILLYAVTATAIALLLWKSKQNPQHNFRFDSENVHMIARYIPPIVGTITILLFRQSVRETLRMVPFVDMADQHGAQTRGSPPWRGVGGAWFPWQSFSQTPLRIISVVSLLTQVIGSFIVSLKVALFASTPEIDEESKTQYWILTIREYPAALLIGGYILMILYTLYIALQFRKKSTGLKWDPVSIADYAALFANCNALEYFAPLELRYDLRPKHLMVEHGQFRLGYWTRVRDNPEEVDTVYGIGPIGRDKQNSRKERDPLGKPWQRRLTFRKMKPRPLPLDECDRRTKCRHGTWPNCEHYPYKHSPGCPRWVVAVGSIFPIAALGLAIYSLVIGLPSSGFSLPNNVKIPSGFHYGFGSSNHTLPPLDPGDPNSNLLLWALIFRSVPTYAAGLFVSTVISWIDLNMRVMQPFRNMLGRDMLEKPPLLQRAKTWLPGAKRTHSNNVQDEPREPANAADSILLAYISTSPLQVPLTAWKKSHWKVCMYSTLNTISPLFPIFVGSVLTVSPEDGLYKRVRMTFSLTAYISVLVFLVLYSVLVPMAMPRDTRLLPRQIYSLADLMALCHQAKFMTSPHLDITDQKETPSKEHMEARILLSGDTFLFGSYKGRDHRRHIGFDATDWTEDSVRYIAPKGAFYRIQRTVTVLLEGAEGTRAARDTSRLAAEPARPRNGDGGRASCEDIELDGMPGAAAAPANRIVRSETSGFQRQTGERPRGRMRDRQSHANY